MEVEFIFKEIEEFSKNTHGSSNYDKDEIYLIGEKTGEFAPLSYIQKKFPEFKEINNLIAMGFIYQCLDMQSDEELFLKWYEKQFSQKLSRILVKKIYLLEKTKQKDIFDSVAAIHGHYEVLRQTNILLNGKNLPVQLGEWYARCIFGLKFIKSSSQRGFDLFFEGKRTEVKVHWSDIPTPKGVKIKKSLVLLSDYTIILYLARNFMIREICFLDSEFVVRKFSDKGHTIFLKDNDISTYFFSKSDKQLERVKNPSALLKFSTPTMAMNLAEKFKT